MELIELNFKEHFASVRDLFVSVFSCPPWNDDWSDRNQLNLYIEELLTPNNALCLGLFKDNKLVAMTLGRKMHFFSGTEYRIDELCVTNELQGQGIGKTLISSVKEYSLNHEIKRFTLVTSKNIGAHTYYLKNGFVDKDEDVTMINVL